MDSRAQGLDLYGESLFSHNGRTGFAVVLGGVTHYDWVWFGLVWWREGPKVRDRIWSLASDFDSVPEAGGRVLGKRVGSTEDYRWRKS